MFHYGPPAACGRWLILRELALPKSRRSFRLPSAILYSDCYYYYRLNRVSFGEVRGAKGYLISTALRGELRRFRHPS